MNYEKNGLKVLQKLLDNNYEAYFVGGYVRDRLLNIDSIDIDITTSAKPQEVLDLFDKGYANGEKYNSVTIIYNNFSYEITSFRKDVIYLDNRHPVIEPAKSLEEDLKRRDYTINAIAMDVNYNLISYDTGLIDLNNKIIKAVGCAKKRFKEDALRILRGFYLVSKLGFDIEINTLKSIKEDAYLLTNISYFRIYNEFKKIVEGKNSLKALSLMNGQGITKYIDGLEMGISYIVSNSIDINNMLEFLIICFYFNSLTISNKWLLSKQDYKYILSIINEIDNKVDIYKLYSLGIDKCLVLNKIRMYLNKDSISDNEINLMYTNLIIKKIGDLAIDTTTLIKVVNKQPGKWINEVLLDIINSINNNKLVNDKEDIIYYLKKKVK